MLIQFLILAGFAVIVPALLWSHPTGYLLFSLAVLVLSLVVLVRPMPQYRMGSRVFALLWVLLAGLPGLMFASSLSVAHLAELRAKDPVAYLSAIENADPDLWFRELRQLDPVRYDIEAAKRAAEARQEREEQAAEADRLRQHQCSDAYASQAYIYAQFFVEDELRAPGTASFPNMRRDDVQVTVVGQCRFNVTSYVDARNAFNAEIRTRFSLTIERLPEEESWKLISINFDQ